MREKSSNEVFKLLEKYFYELTAQGRHNFAKLGDRKTPSLRVFEAKKFLLWVVHENVEKLIERKVIYAKQINFHFISTWRFSHELRLRQKQAANRVVDALLFIAHTEFLAPSLCFYFLITQHMRKSTTKWEKNLIFSRMTADFYFRSRSTYWSLLEETTQARTRVAQSVTVFIRFIGIIFR